MERRKVEDFTRGSKNSAQEVHGNEQLWVSLYNSGQQQMSLNHTLSSETHDDDDIQTGRSSIV